MMKVQLDIGFCQVLQGIDREKAEKMRLQGCPVCGGPLYYSNYPRKPRADFDWIVAHWTMRYSLCCGREGCRTRHTPESVRFLGRKVYVGVYLVLIAAMMCGVNGRRAGQLHRELGLDPRTLNRWRRWWLEHFPSTPFWRWERSRFMPKIEERDLPGSLLQALGGSCHRGLLSMLEFLAPITTRQVGQGLVM